MHVFRRIDLKIKKHTSFDHLVIAAQRVCSADIGECHAKFALRDCRNTTALERVKRKFPILASFEYQYEEGGSDWFALSNFGPGWFRGNPKPPTDRIPLDVLLEIASGVPRAYAFSYAEVAFLNVSWLDMRAKKVPIIVHHDRIVQFPVDPSISIISSWGSPRRRIEVVAASPVDAPTPSAERLPAISDEILSRLDSIAEVGRIRLEVTLSPKEIADQLAIRPELDAIREKYVREPLCGSNEALPHSLDKSADSVGGVPIIMFKELGFPSIKKCLISAFRPLGYKYSKNYNLSKLSKCGNLLEVSFDYSPMMGSLCAGMSVKGPLGHHSVGMNVGAGPNRATNQHMGYAIHDARMLVDVIENCAALVKIWEGTLIPEIEKHWPPAPAWYAHEIFK